jgi:arabinose-5-phosphate isomerase
MKLEIETASKVLEIEARGLDRLRERLSTEPQASNFVRAIDLVGACKGKVIIAGMGKSGLIGEKLLQLSLRQARRRSFFIPAESSHGDLGMIAADDVVIGISYSGEVPELEALLRFVARKNLP